MNKYGSWGKGMILLSLRRSCLLVNKRQLLALPGRVLLVSFLETSLLLGWP